MSEHSSFAALAVELIAEEGRTINLITNAKSGDAWNPTITASSTPVKAVNVGLNNKELANSLIRTTDTVFLIDATVEPTLSMTLSDGKELSIIHITTTKPGDQIIMYRVVARG